MAEKAGHFLFRVEACAYAMYRWHELPMPVPVLQLTWCCYIWCVQIRIFNQHEYGGQIME